MKKLLNRLSTILTARKWSAIIGLIFVQTLLIASIVVLILAYAEEVEDKDLLWEDNFDFLDEAKWTHVISGYRGGNNEFQYYRKDERNCYIENGVLKIKPTLVKDEMSDYEMRNGYQNLKGCNLEPCTIIASPLGDSVLPVYSAEIHTKNKFKFKYGRIEIRAKLPSGDWLKPTIALLPNDNTYGGWPASGGIAIVESRGNKNLTNQKDLSVGANVVEHTLHWGPNFRHNKWFKTHYEMPLSKGYYSDDFHIYEVVWTPEHIAIKIDGMLSTHIIPPPGGFWEIGNFNREDVKLDNIWKEGSKMAPFDASFYIKINVAVGGTFFDDTFKSWKPWNWNSGTPLLQFSDQSNAYIKTWDHPELEIDYIRVYKD